MYASMMDSKREIKLKKYEQVLHYLLSFIEQMSFTQDIRLPSENALCRRLGVSRETVRTAIAVLREDGIITTRKGSGTFVNKRNYLKLQVPPSKGKIRIGAIIQGQDYNANKNLLRGIKQALANDSVDLRIFYTDNKLANERKCLLSCSTHFHGLIVDGVKASILNTNLDCYSRLHEQNVRIIFYNNYYADAPFPRVTIADRECAEELVQRLTTAGHRHIAGIFAYDNYQGIEKYKGYVNSLVQHGAIYDDRYVKLFISDDTNDPKEFKRTLRRFLASIPECTAIVCGNYMILKTLLALLDELGKHVPRDYSVVGFDYSDTDWMDSGITASIHPGYEMGYEVGSRILKMIEDERYKEHSYSHLFQPTIYDGWSIKNLFES